MNIDRQKAARYGLNVATSRTPYYGHRRRARGRHAVRGRPPIRHPGSSAGILAQRLESMKRLLILPRAWRGRRTEAGTNFIQLAEVASFELAPGPQPGQPGNGKRRIVVSANVRGRDVGSLRG